MRKPLIITSLTLTLLLLTFNSVAQPTIQWEKSYGGSNNETANSVLQTLDGGYIVAGGTSSNDGDVTLNKGGTDCWVVKLDANGIIEWQKTYGGSGNDFINSIIQLPDSGYVFTGSSNSSDGDVPDGNGTINVWVVKIDVNGVIQWEKSYGGVSADGSNQVLSTKDGGYVVVGVSDANGVNNDDYWVIKLDILGNIQWQKLLGGSNIEEAFSVVQTADLGYLVLGESTSNDGNVSSNYGGRDYWIVKLDSMGNIEWEKNYGGSGFDRGKAVVSDGVGGYIISGRSDSNDGDITGNKGGDDYWIVNIDSLGNILWQKNYGGTASDDFQKIIAVSDGGYVMIGSSGSSDGDVTANYGNWDYWVVKIDSIGTIEWEKNYGGSFGDFGYAISETTDNGFIIAGQTGSIDLDVSSNNGIVDFWVVKLNPLTGIDELKNENDQLLYPNPTTGNFYVSVQSVKSVVKVYTLLGEEVLGKNLNKGKNKIDLNFLPNGVYLIKVKGVNSVYTQKLILNH